MSSEKERQDKIVQAWKKNVELVPKYLNDPTSKNYKNLMKKVETYTNNFGFNKDKVIEKIKTDKMFAATFAIDPRKQSIDEKTALSNLKKIDAIDQLEKLPGSGKKALYVSSDGDIRKGEDIGGNSRPSKSLDFQWITGKTIFYAMHKRTTSYGGSQDTTKGEMIRVLNNFQKCTSRQDIALMIILDGDYWDRRIKELKKITRDQPPKSYVLRSEDISNVLQIYL